MTSARRIHRTLKHRPRTGTGTSRPPPRRPKKDRLSGALLKDCSGTRTGPKPSFEPVPFVVGFSGPWASPTGLDCLRSVQERPLSALVATSPASDLWRSLGPMCAVSLLIATSSGESVIVCPFVAL